MKSNVIRSTGMASLKHLFWLCVCIFATTMCQIHATAAPKGAAPVVKIESGDLEGTRLDASSNAAAFLGVPYAAPPIRNLRWKPPQPAGKWSGVRAAKRYGPACPQLPASWLPTIPWNEDCLYLNVWTPNLSVHAKLPVLVYIHGGSNTVGYSQMTPLGPMFAQLGVVVVSANYRIGPFGFFALPALTAESQHHASGNYGLLDQIQALRWIRKNISQFGGDPGKVTVMAQSAGAVDTCLLMTSPLARGLFEGAIMESGECQSTLIEDRHTPISYNSIRGRTGESSGERLAKDLGIAAGPDMLAKLRSVPAGQILKIWSQDPQLNFGAIVDGWVVPRQPLEIFAEGKQMRIPVIVGANSDEATVFGHNMESVDDYRHYLRQESGKYSDQEFREYPAASDAEAATQRVRIESDSFAYGAHSLAEAVTHSGDHAYLYLFTYAETGKRAPLGAYHGMELKFLSNSFPSDWNQTKDDGPLGKAMREYWAQFAKTGDPNGEGLPHWPSYGQQPNHYFELGRTIGVRSIPQRLELTETLMHKVAAEVLENPK